MKKIDSLTSLRFFAAACIVLGHGGSRFHYKVELFDLRHGVTFFFVLSGFILSYNYSGIKLLTGLRDFFAARVARVFPACIVTTVLAAILFSPITNAEDMLKLAVNILLLQAWVPISSWHYAYNGVTWSVSAEMFFYIVFPAVLSFAKTIKSLVVFVIVPAAVMLSLASFLNLSTKEGGPDVTTWGLIYVNPLTRVSEFICGILAYRLSENLAQISIVWSYKKATVIELGGLILAFLAMIVGTYIGKHTLNETAPQLSVWVQVISPFPFIALFIAIMRQEKGGVSRALSWTALVYLGEISFSLYLTHQIVVRWMFLHYEAKIHEYPVLGYISYWLISLLLATILFHLVEKPLRAPLRKLMRGKCRQDMTQHITISPTP